MPQIDVHRTYVQMKNPVTRIGANGQETMILLLLFYGRAHELATTRSPALGNKMSRSDSNKRINAHQAEEWWQEHEDRCLRRIVRKEHTPVQVLQCTTCRSRYIAKFCSENIRIA
ncbi:hypothetical protein Tco_0412925 [Tanacetum coccineum]